MNNSKWTMITSDGQTNNYIGSIDGVTGTEAPHNCPDGSSYYAFKGTGAPKLYMYDSDNDIWVEQ